MGNRNDELWKELDKAMDNGDSEGMLDSASELSKLGDKEAPAYVSLAMFLKGYTESSIAANGDAEELITYSRKATATLYSAVDLAVGYLVQYPKNEACGVASSTLSGAFGLLYQLALSGNTFGYKVIRDGEKFKEATITRYRDMVLVEETWEKFHDEYYSFIPPTSFSSFTDADEESKHIEKCISSVINNVQNVTDVLERVGKVIDADYLRARVAHEASEGKRGNKVDMLTAIYFLNKADYAASKKDKDSYEVMKAYQQTTYDLIEDMIAKNERTIANYINRNYEPSIYRYYLNGENVKLVSTPGYEATIQKIVDKYGSASKGAILAQTYLGVIKKITFGEYFMPMVTCGIYFFMFGGLLPLWKNFSGDWTAFVLRGASIVWLILTVFWIFLRSLRMQGNNYGLDHKKYILIMVLFTVALNLHYIGGIILFVLLKVAAKFYS